MTKTYRRKHTHSNDQKDMSRLNIWVPRKDYEKLKIKALKNGRTVSDVLRELVKSYV